VHREVGTTAGGAGPVPRLLPTRHTDHGPGVPARVPVGVWDGEDLVGVCAEESTARADAAVVQRDAARGAPGAERDLPAPAGVHPVPDGEAVPFPARSPVRAVVSPSWWLWAPVFGVVWVVTVVSVLALVVAPNVRLLVTAFTGVSAAQDGLRVPPA